MPPCAGRSSAVCARTMSIPRIARSGCAQRRRRIGAPAWCPGADACGHVAVGEQEPESRLGGVKPIGVDEEEMGEAQVGEKNGDAIVAAAGDEAVAVTVRLASGRK